MVATRNHPKDFEPLPTDSPAKPSPTKRSTRASSVATTASSTTTKPLAPASQTRIATESSKALWAHTPSNLTLIWLAISLPLVIWDTGYVLLRPHSMPGGKFHAPIWTPYELYGRIDYVYGWPSYHSNNGWTAAQGAVNAVETTAYLVYLYLVFAYGQPEATQGRGAPEKSSLGSARVLGESRTLRGKLAATAVLLAYSTSLVTFAKTILYWLIEAFSGFEAIGHNDWTTLIFLWIIPNGAWIVFPAYMCYVFGSEVIEGLGAATNASKKLR